MKLFRTSKTEERIIEILEILSDEKRKKISEGVTEKYYEGVLAKANDPLLAELDILKMKRQFEHDKQQLLVNVISITIALLIAFGVPFIL